MRHEENMGHKNNERRGEHRPMRSDGGGEEHPRPTECGHPHVWRHKYSKLLSAWRTQKEMTHTQDVAVTFDEVLTVRRD